MDSDSDLCLPTPHLIPAAGLRATPVILVLKVTVK